MVPGCEMAEEQTAAQVIIMIIAIIIVLAVGFILAILMIRSRQ